ncbi:metallophosphoesterase [Candidatus Woesearchaeota archaeon]|nr:metallophosphoesterase [Candidatus Woesearchaeota archaeon]
MKILTIGDSHGRLPFLAPKLIKKYNPDFLVCTGDLAYSDKVRKAIFGNWKKLSDEGMSLADVIGTKKQKTIETEAAKSINYVLKYLNSLGKKVYLIYGNNDYTKEDIKEAKIKALGIEQQVKKYKNVRLLINAYVDLGDANLVAVSGYRGANKIAGKNIKNTEHYSRLSKLFKKSKNKETILLYHDVPFNTRFDLVKNKMSPLNGKHVGSKIIRKILSKYKPILYICGHMHENPGVIRIGRTVCLNTGLVQNKDYFVININGSKVSVKKVK